MEFGSHKKRPLSEKIELRHCDPSILDPIADDLNLVTVGPPCSIFMNQRTSAIRLFFELIKAVYRGAVI